MNDHESLRIFFAVQYRRLNIFSLRFSPNSSCYLANPNGIWIDGQAGVIYVADSHENLLRTSVFKHETFEFIKQCVFTADKVRAKRITV